MSIELCNELVNVGAVNDASFFETFHAGSGAAEAVHTDLEEIDCSGGVKIKNIANDAFSGNFHCDTKPFYYTFNDPIKTVFFQMRQKYSATILFYHIRFSMSISFFVNLFLFQKNFKSGIFVVCYAQKVYGKFYVYEAIKTKKALA